MRLVCPSHLASHLLLQPKASSKIAGSTDLMMMMIGMRRRRIMNGRKLPQLTSISSLPTPSGSNERKSSEAFLRKYLFENIEIGRMAV